MNLKTEKELIALGERIGAALTAPAVLELIGDVGAGKTTLTKGIARGLGLEDEITSPSYTISKRYQNDNITLVHYDFYRLDDPGLMAEDLAETLSDPSTIAIIEWGNSIGNVLGKNHPQITISVQPDGSRDIALKNLPQEIQL